MFLLVILLFDWEEFIKLIFFLLKFESVLLLVVEGFFVILGLILNWLEVSEILEFCLDFVCDVLKCVFLFEFLCDNFFCKIGIVELVLGVLFLRLLIVLCWCVFGLVLCLNIFLFFYELFLEWLKGYDVVSLFGVLVWVLLLFFELYLKFELFWEFLFFKLEWLKNWLLMKVFVWCVLKNWMRLWKLLGEFGRFLNDLLREGLKGVSILLLLLVRFFVVEFFRLRG